MNQKKISYILMAPAIIISSIMALFYILIEIYTMLIELKDMIISQIFIDGNLDTGGIISFTIIMLFTIGVVLYVLSCFENIKRKP